MVADEKGRLSKAEICESVGITAYEFDSWRRAALLPGPAFQRQFGGRGSEAYYDGLVLDRVLRIKELRRGGLSLDRIRLELGLPVELTEDQRKFMRELAVPIDPNPGLATALQEAGDKVRQIMGGADGGVPLFCIERRGEELYLVVTGIGQ